MDLVKPSSQKEKDRLCFEANKGNKEPDDHGGELSSTIIPSWPLGRPRSSRQAQEAKNPSEQSLQASLPPKKRVLKSQKLQGNPLNGLENYVMQSRMISTVPPRAPATMIGSISQAIGKPSVQPPFGSDADVSIRGSGNCSSQSNKSPNLEPNKSPRPPSIPPPTTGFKSHPVTVASAHPHLKYSNVDVSRSHSNGQEDMWPPLRAWRSRKRLHGKNHLPNVEEVANVPQKKTRLGWGEGLAKYEKEQREKELMKASALVISGDHNDSSTITSEMVACPDIVPNLSCGSRASHSAISAIGDQGTCNLPSGANGDSHNSISGMAQKEDCSSASGCNIPQAGVSGDPGICNTSITKSIACEEAPSSHTSQGDKCDILRSSASKTELMVVCSTDVPSFTCGNSPTQGENNNLTDRSVRVIEIVVSPGTVPSSEGCSLPTGEDMQT